MQRTLFPVVGSACSPLCPYSQRLCRTGRRSPSNKTSSTVALTVPGASVKEIDFQVS